MKYTQENELLSLIKYVKLSKNKKLILNSRITIFNEAKERSLEFNIFFQEKKIRNFTINMNEITSLEKAKIFYNHLICKHVPKEYYDTIKSSKNYIKIIQHGNYTPRIIEHVTYSTNYLKVAPAEYFNYIFKNLSNPNDIWKNEFERRLQDVDRAFISTIYSLTDTNVEYGVLKKCFDNRLSQMNNVDYTVDNYESILSRLNQSVINIIDNKGRMHIGVINPSVNDYMKSVYDHNRLELNEVRRSIGNYKQIVRCYSKEELPKVYVELIVSSKVDDITFENEEEKNYFITAHICQNSIKKVCYKKVIHNYLRNAYGYYFAHNDWLSHVEILSSLLNKKLYSYYSIDRFLLKEDCISDLLLDLDLEDLIKTINLLARCYNENNKYISWFKPLCKRAINNAISSYVENIDISDYCDNYDISDLINQNLRTYYYKDNVEEELDKDAATEALKKWVAEDIENEIVEKLSDLDENIYAYVNMSITKCIDTDGLVSVIDSYLEPGDYDYEEHGHSSSAEIYISEIEAIFER